MLVCTCTQAHFWRTLPNSTKGNRLLKMTIKIKFIVALFLILSEIGCNRFVVKPLSQSFDSVPDCAVPKDKNALVSFSVPLILNCRFCAGKNGGIS